MSDFKFIECSSPFYERTTYGEKKTFYNPVVNLIQVVDFSKVDSIYGDSDKESTGIKNSERFGIVFYGYRREIYWVFPTREERDKNYDTLVHYYASIKIKEEWDKNKK